MARGPSRGRRRGRLVTQDLLALIPQYGALLVALTTFLSCLALPVPASLIMLAGGALAAGGDLSVLGIGLGALTGALLGDQTGFAIGRRGERLLDRLIARYPKRAGLIDRARAFTNRWGGPGVYFSRWLVSPLGPYVNLLAGSARMNWLTFTFWDVLGEATWVTLYVGLGWFFAGRIEAVADILGNLSGALAAGLVTVLLGTYLFRRKPGKSPDKQGKSP